MSPDLGAKRRAYTEESVGNPLKAQVVVIGSGAGGALTAAVLAERGYDVLILEEGPDVDAGSIVSNSTGRSRASTATAA